MSLSRLTVLLCGLVISSSVFAYGDSDDVFLVGLKAGGEYSWVNHLDKILVSENYYSGYDFSHSGCIGPSVTLFARFRSADKPLGLEGDLNYYQLGGGTEYTDIKGLDYTMSVRYNYVGAGAYLLYYPMGRLHVGLGGRVSFNLNAEGLSYESNQESLDQGQYNYESASATEGHLRDKIKGDMDASAGCMVGYTFDHGISLEAGYHFGLGDLMETKTNNYRWIDPTNWVQSVYFKLGYAISALGK